MKTKNIVFDFGNVIMKYDVDEMLGLFKLSEDDKLMFRSLIFDSPLWKDGDRGYCNRDVIFGEALKKLPEHLREVFYSLVARYDFETEFMPFNEGIDELIKELKNSGYKLYLLSNIGLNFHIMSLKIPVFGIFDGLFPSCDYGVIKPEKKIYELFFERFSRSVGILYNGVVESAAKTCAYTCEIFLADCFLLCQFFF